MISIENEECHLGQFLVFHDEPTYKLKRIEVDPVGDSHMNTIIDAMKLGL